MATDNSWLDNRPPRLGDLIDDHCPRCKRLMNHAIASFVGDKVVKVICQTCYSEHPYLEGKEKKKAPKPQFLIRCCPRLRPHPARRRSPLTKTKGEVRRPAPDPAQGQAYGEK